MTDISLKTAALEHIYRVCQEYLETLKPACHRGCATCCTTGVVITSLEAWVIAEYLARQGRDDLFETIQAAASQPRRQPRETLNRLAEIYSREECLPEEADPDFTTPCPLLSDDQCPLYPARPFACRCLVSQSHCRKQGFARIDPFTLTVNNVMLQYIEHVDRTGVTGNMLDLVLFLRSEEDRKRYAAGDISFLSRRFVVNSPATVLMAGPDDKEALRPILHALNRGG